MGLTAASERQGQTVTEQVRLIFISRSAALGQEETGRAGSLSVDRLRKIKEIRKFSRQLTRPMSSGMNIAPVRPAIRLAISKKRPVPLDQTLHVFSICFCHVQTRNNGRFNRVRRPRT